MVIPVVRWAYTWPRQQTVTSTLPEMYGVTDEQIDENIHWWRDLYARYTPVVMW